MMRAPGCGLDLPERTADERQGPGPCNPIKSYRFQDRVQSARPCWSGRCLFSSSNGRYYFDIRFGTDVYNPNIVPHPKFNNTWYIVGQLWADDDPAVHANHFYEAGCMAQFINGALMDIAGFNLNVGPRDARVFVGPQNPFITFGSNSGYTCLGLWIQDFRQLVDWEYELMTNTDFKVGTALQRPGTYFPLEKNYFLFWDDHDQMHVHQDMYPKRMFASLERNGSTGPDLAPKAATFDEKCLTRYMPKMPPDLESIHQATNSLKITMCNRADKKCSPHAGNTFIMAIIQHKTYYSYHSEYEPYVVLFQQRAPYELYAISKKPLWISGRKRHTGRATDMMYVTSVNWQERGVNYHGYLDDIAILGFGYEDKGSGGIDVRACDLLVDMGPCEEP
ncbi:hypothetical protein C8A00DRAFT_43530 [Chaetomidium leptoderma]|uniref:Uncharacterized protein n=1 Tax=Chaetomidium leptoderma TaxID=669021 RepID=A0AAN6VLZ5_9PEZI|nr:hypothetical protein C8A00DRAFT_43530 [Chaetomidium leptoderma]